MPDFKEEIRKRLAELSLSPTREGEIVEELSQHLEDQFEQAVQRGATEQEAYQAVLRELNENELLAPALKRVERRMPPNPVVMGKEGKTNMIGRSLAGFTLRAADAVEEPRVHHRRGHRPGARDRREQRHLQRGQHRPAAPIALQKSGCAHDRLGRRDAYGISLQHAVAREFSRLARTEHGVRRHGGAGRSAALTSPAPASRSASTAARSRANLFTILGVEPVLGRNFLPEEDKPGSRVVILSYGVWQRRFGGDTGIIGRALTLNGESYTVVGVMPGAVDLPEHGQLARPALGADRVYRRGSRQPRQSLPGSDRATEAGRDAAAGAGRDDHDRRAFGEAISGGKHPRRDPGEAVARADWWATSGPPCSFSSARSRSFC